MRRQYFSATTISSQVKKFFKWCEATFYEGFFGGALLPMLTHFLVFYH